MRFLKIEDRGDNVVRISYDKTARHQLGSVVVAIPKAAVGTAVQINSPLFTVETNRRLSKVRSPVSGVVVDVNKNLEKNISPGIDLWLCDIHALPRL